MLFVFLNVETTARSLIEESPVFTDKYPQVSDGITFLKQQAVKLFDEFYADANDATDVADGVLHVPVWKNVGVTFAAIAKPNPPKGEEWPVSFQTPRAEYVEVNYWASLPLK